MSCILRTPERIERRNVGSPRNRRSCSPSLSAAGGWRFRKRLHSPGNRFLGDTAFGFDFAFFVEEVDGLHRTQSAHVHCAPSQEDSEFPLGENRHRHHAHRTFYRGSPIPMSLRRDSLSRSASLSLSASLFLSLSPSLPLPISILHLSLSLSPSFHVSSF